ncbi:hypothetical protein Nepgr_016583 [Nepenthes gracilis]|uniref:EF-hand domain-containing protein n=1 Tax=Nepenthes gracilis TaxID=150966 RepID=A0AAD3XRF9_NEPGR|nr:hypothetical protein Nepgr_016583 [Nepenthes gracilis]
MAAACLPRPSRWFCAKGITVSHNKEKSPKSSCSTSGSSRSNTSPFASKVYSREDEQKEIFRHFDIDNDGKISALELREYFASIGEHMSHEDAQGVIDDLDSDGDRMLDFQDFVKLMDGKRGAGDGDDDDLKKVFEMFEYEKGSGRITPRGLQRMFDRLGDSKSHDECAAMIQIYDVDGDGELDFLEFHKMMS